MHTTATSAGLTFGRRLTTQSQNPFEEVSWDSRDAVITDAKGNTNFEQRDIKAPTSWSDTAVRIVASKYFHGQLGTPARESSVEQLISRVANTIGKWGYEDNYFASEEDAETFTSELIALLLNQYAAFNSPVFFNVGCDSLEPDNKSKSWYFENGKIVRSQTGYTKPQCSACFINSVDDSMESILELAKTEGMLFKHGSGAGSNLSAIRAANEMLSGGGTASGPLSFMRGFDAFAGVIKSGGKTRRAAKMVILNADHPDIEEFITCKGKEEAKAHTLIANGYDGDGPDSEAYASVFFQNANNSVRVTNEFMHAVENDLPWALTARKDGRVVKTVSAKELLRQIAAETWRCGDPGMQFDTTINMWNPCPDSGRINASNPCSEYMFLDDSACNLASLNLVRFLRPDGTFDVELFSHAVRIFIVAQDILVDRSGYPTEKIAVNSHDFRPLGLGFANLGALLLQLGMPYDSEEGRNLAGAITALMTGMAYDTSAELAESLPPSIRANGDGGDAAWNTGAFSRYNENAGSFMTVIGMHQEAANRLNATLPGLVEAARAAWKSAKVRGLVAGFRNAQVTVLAPTGTISFMMDCDTTGIEPMLGLVAYKKLVGGGYMTLVNQTAKIALERLGYTHEDVDAICNFITDNGTIEGAPGLLEAHLPIFDCALKPAKGMRFLTWRAHVEMMAACQPFLSGAISKTVNLPSDATVEDIANTYLESWRMGLKAVAIYRDGSKMAQPMSVSKTTTIEMDAATAQDLDPNGPPAARRHRLPDERTSLTHKFGIAGHEGYITVGLYPNGKPGELFLKMAKEGSTMSGLMDTIGTLVSVSLQYGVPLKVLCDKLAHMSFEPSGWTGSEEMGYAKSIPDYVFRWLNLRFVEGQQLSLPNFQPALPMAPTAEVQDSPVPTQGYGDAPTCSACGALMSRKAGSCWACTCGETSGCS